MIVKPDDDEARAARLVSPPRAVEVGFDTVADGLDDEAAEAQDELMGITDTLIEQAERFEARLDRRKRT